MKILKQSRFVLVAPIILCTVCSVYAIWEIADEGLWPTNWPKELEPLRKQSRTGIHSAQARYEIPFANREEFESAWPHILELKSKQAPLILLSSPDEKLGGTLKAGVRIWSPRTGTLVTPNGTNYPPGAEASVPDGKFLKIGPPWPDYIKSESGALPEYVFNDNGKWAPYDPNAKKELLAELRSPPRRARTDIELVIDGNIVDLNRIPLPADTPIIDKRFKDKHDK
jgi:hypothetical protein